jgi:hypothetical protein
MHNFARSSISTAVLIIKVFSRTPSTDSCQSLLCVCENILPFPSFDFRSQADLQHPRGYLIQEVPVQEGELKTQNDGDEIQRPVITDREGSKFTVYVELVTCVHGQLGPEDSTPASLIVFQYEIHCREEACVIKSVRTSLEFAQNQLHAPSVQAYAPYIRRRYNATSGNVTDTKGVEGTLGADFTPAKADVKLSAQREESREQQYFEKLESGRHFHDTERRHHKVWWRLSQNQSQKAGVTPAFRTAILLKRKDHNRFTATFDIELDGGFQYSTSKLLNRIFGRIAQDELDDPIIFDPGAEAWGQGTIDPTCLGKYAKGAMLDSSLAPVWGVDIGE